ncbi:MAG: ABC transporter ATP-binding protein [Chloroflexi bacterium]|nr:ABC transporter ATP-binding protein [Chloroflexota bacterium]
MINVEALTFHYKTTPVFENFNWQAQSGDSWAVLGPSGCGKSTLLALLAGLRFPSAGKVRINGEILKRPRPHTGLILQDYGLLPWATVRQNAGLGLAVRAFYGADGIHAPRELSRNLPVESWLERLGLNAMADKYPAQLSGGQRQRTAIARTLALQPDLLLMDEPFSSLDAPTREALQTLTMELVAEHGLTLVMVTHSIEEAALLGRKILLLNEPPNHAAHVIENTSAGKPGYRDNAEYQALCRELREKM